MDHHDEDERQSEETPLPEAGELRLGTTRLAVRGRALRLVLWLAEHQATINFSAPCTGQLSLSWKGDGKQSISGDLRTFL
jgi:hypothetical protein